MPPVGGSRPSSVTPGATPELTELEAMLTRREGVRGQNQVVREFEVTIKPIHLRSTSTVTIFTKKTKSDDIFVQVQPHLSPNHRHSPPAQEMLQILSSSPAITVQLAQSTVSGSDQISHPPGMLSSRRNKADHAVPLKFRSLYFPQPLFIAPLCPPQVLFAVSLESTKRSAYSDLSHSKP